MSEKNRGSQKRLRQRLRGKTGKAIGFASLAAPVAAFVVNDLKKPDSLIRNLGRIAAAKLLPESARKRLAIDVTDQVEIIETEQQSQLDSPSQ